MFWPDILGVESIALMPVPVPVGESWMTGTCTWTGTGTGKSTGTERIDARTREDEPMSCGGELIPLKKQ
ncbi:MAG: hypothetical protein EA399_08285 [Desulfovibrionales bacterium]|nr:MAG: hypothetical protein EA399_08285 [Desulfovibrionales bacterium]